MEQIKIAIHVPKAAALAAGRSNYGDMEFSPSDAQLAELSDADLAGVARSSVDEYGKRPDWRDVLRVPDVTWDAVRAAIRQASEQRAAIREQEILGLLAEPAEAWLGGWAGVGPVLFDDDPRLLESRVRHLQDDPRIADRLERDVSPLLSARSAAYSAALAARAKRDQEAQAMREAERVARDAAMAQAAAALRAYALTVTELARAAREGYEVAGAVVDHVAGLIASVASGKVIREGSPEWSRYAWSDRQAPRPEAFAMLDLVTSHMSGLSLPPAVDAEVLRVQRVSYTPSAKDDYGDEPEPEKFTGVVVLLSALGTVDRAIVFRCE